MSKIQNLKNHAQYYPFHHFFIAPLTLIYFIWTLIDLDFTSTASTTDSIKSFILALILLAMPLLARIYALKNQNRIIFAEMRARYAELTGTPFKKKESKLNSGQIIALRFASDEELIALIDEAIEKQLSSKEIKSRVKNWQGDYRRV